MSIKFACLAGKATMNIVSIPEKKALHFLQSNYSDSSLRILSGWRLGGAPILCMTRQALNFHYTSVFLPALPTCTVLITNVLRSGISSNRGEICFYHYSVEQAPREPEQNDKIYFDWTGEVLKKGKELYPLLIWWGYLPYYFSFP